VVKNSKALLQKSILSEINDNIFKIVESDYKSYVRDFIRFNSIEVKFMKVFLERMLVEGHFVKENDRKDIEKIDTLNGLKMYMYLSAPKIELSRFISTFVFRDSDYKNQQKEFFNELMKITINNALKDREFTNIFINDFIDKTNLAFKDFDISKLEGLLFSIEEPDEEEISVDRRKIKLKK
jgi:hypothetical protein